MTNLNFVCRILISDIILLILAIKRRFLSIFVSSGANMAEAVWDTIVLYGLEGRVSNYKLILSVTLIRMVR